jgi:hypothetical protein
MSAEYLGGVVGGPIAGVLVLAFLGACITHLISEKGIKRLSKIYVYLMSSLQSDAARVLYFEKSLLIGGSNDEPLSGEERLEVRKQFFAFLKNDLRSLSFSGLRWWKLLHIPQCLPIIYQQKLLKIINDRSVIEEGDLTLYFILVVVRKILKTVETVSYRTCL